jgi:hypothetical protein
MFKQLGVLYQGRRAKDLSKCKCKKKGVAFATPTRLIPHLVQGWTSSAHPSDSALSQDTPSWECWCVVVPHLIPCRLLRVSRTGASTSETYDLNHFLLRRVVGCYTYVSAKPEGYFEHFEKGFAFANPLNIKPILLAPFRPSLSPLL